ncbi:MAG: ADP-ribosylglycohydrolase family protein, partial [Bacteroidales bacterium]|nr:ADP-ribosylglycohydrolase family protein [Bacteroidales bacterium]MBN2758360.1 ADP-ribosylglycohydrolase family protein [Bacteroidales bacterium]
CFYYVEYAISIIKGEEKLNAYYITNHTVNAFFDSNEKYIYEKTFFDRILSGEIYDLQEDDILSSGYVIDSLEAALWCFFKNDDYKSTVLNAVNLGEDTDTIAAIVGGLAGIYYGFDSIPENWINSIAKKNEIEKLCNRFYLSM